MSFNYQTTLSPEYNIRTKASTITRIDSKIIIFQSSVVTQLEAHMEVHIDNGSFMHRTEKMSPDQAKTRSEALPADGVVIERHFTFDECKEHSIGTTYYLESVNSELFLLILRGPASLCSYIGFPKDSALKRVISNSRFDFESYWESEQPSVPYEWIGKDLPISCHGGITFSGDSVPKNEFGMFDGITWYGWDYAHANDKPMYNIAGFEIGKKWSTREVLEDSKIAFQHLKNLWHSVRKYEDAAKKRSKKENTNE